MRKEGSTGTFVLFFDWDMWVPLVLSVMRLNTSNLEEIPDHSFANSIIQSASPEQQREHANLSTSQEIKRPLTKQQKKANMDRQYNDMVSVVNMLFLPAWGCIHLWCEWYLYSKSNTRPPASFRDALGPCADKCYVCNKSYAKYMLPVIHEGAVEYLSSDCMKASLFECNPVTFDNCSNIPKALMENTDLRRRVFGIQTVNRYNVQAFYIQLVASKMLAFELTPNRDVRCVLAKDSDGKECYKDLRYWSGFEFRRAGFGGGSISHNDLATRASFRNYFLATT